MYNLVVSFAVPDEERGMIEKTLSGHCSVAFLYDVPQPRRAEVISGADVLLSWSPSREYGEGDFSSMGNVKLLQLVSAGADHLPFDRLRPDMVVASNVGAYSLPMAEHVMAMALALLKGLVAGHRKMSGGEFDQLTKSRMLDGAVCGILGYGGIGRAVACYLRAFHAKIFAINTSGRTDDEVAFVGTLKDLGHVLSHSDVVVIALPLTKHTRGIIGREQLGSMKRDAVLINVARGEIVDEGALYDHLKANPEFMAGIDAWWVEPFRHGEFRIDHPFFGLQNLLGSPHNSAIVQNVLAMGVRAALENVMRFVRKEKIKGMVDFRDYV
ncbi:MAG: 2-hydroxyacid dehydrogenase [Deltaproteobacteria bacterium]|nr:2-hydroxyacid dehydrogenase [Deltaproteobacteria bacterium]MCL5278204.1 2-hydroxyacid dehydrogenase [Deltaproteobacteria bacterium]